MGHPERGRFLHDGWHNREPVHVFEHMTKDELCIVMPLKRDAGDWAVPRDQIIWLPDRPKEDAL